MDRFGRLTKITVLIWANGPIFLPWTAHLIYKFRRTITKIKMWIELDGWKNGRKSVRRGLALTFAKCKSNILYITSEINQEWNISLAQLVLAELTRCWSELTGHACY